MNYIVMLNGYAIGFCQEKWQAEKMKPDLPGAEIYEANNLAENTVILFGREYVKIE